MSEDSNHEDWLKKYANTKNGKLFDIICEIEQSKRNFVDVESISYLAAVASILAKNTKHEKDVKHIITMLYPEYFDE